jgi:hypothetical protein
MKGEIVMAKTTVKAGVCGFTTIIKANSEDGQQVKLEIESECPHVQKANLEPLDALDELFKKPHETEVYKTLSEHLPHVTCPVYSGVLKTAEVAAGLALPEDVSMEITK